jgi:hypothetical protein
MKQAKQLDKIAPWGALLEGVTTATGSDDRASQLSSS